MTQPVAVLIPVLGRPHRVAPLVKSISTGTPEPHSILFICDPDDRATQDAVARAGCRMISPGGTYAKKINAGVAATSEPWLLFGADDLDFQRGWLPAAAEVIEQGAQVVGLNDLRPRDRETATHFLVTRDYATVPTIDGRPGPLHDGYLHNFPDRELIETAQHRGVYAYAENAVVEHLHHLDGRAPMDAIYAKGDATFRADRRTFRRRSSLWT